MNLRQGSRGQEVQALTEALVTLGYLDDPSLVFDEVTDAAVRTFQTDEYLAVDGIAGPQTIGRIHFRAGQRIKYLVVHHSASPRSTTVDAIRNYHMSHHGWRDIAYHYLLRQPLDTSPVDVSPGRSQNGNAFIEKNESGAHVYGSVNFCSLGICCIGNFDENKMPEKMYVTLVRLLSTYCTAWGLGVDAILGHKEVPDQNTHCPGDKLDLIALRADVQRLLQTGVNS